jgi:arylsulfatase A-like enzyme
MLRVLIPLISTITLTVSAVSVAATEKGVSEKPNLVIILADDLGYGDVGFTGSKQIKTPHLDLLAKSGVIFDQGYVSAPVCGPSRAGLITGRNQVNFGFDNNLVARAPQYNKDHFGLPLSETTIADRLQALGYVTGLMGKWHLGDEAHFQAENRGFDSVWTYPHGGHDYFRVDPTSKEKYLQPLISNYKTPDPITYITDDTGNESVEFIRKNKNNPFFLYASFNAPHAPLQAPEEDIKRYAHIKDEKRRIYSAMVHRLDVNVGKIVDELKAQKLYDNTIIVFLSDNGGPKAKKNPWTVNAPFRGSKGNLLEGGIRVPFIMSWPNEIKARTRFSHAVSALDLTPTFVKAAGGKIVKKDKLDGVNLLPFIAENIEVVRHKEMMWRFTISASILDGDWKLVRLPDRLPLLYNLKTDPSELNNVASKHLSRVESMLKTLGGWTLSTPELLYQEGARYKRVQLNAYDDTYQLIQPE